MNATKDSKVNFKELVDLSQKDILSQMRSGKVFVPPKGTEDRAAFEKFCAAEPGSDERKAFLPSEEPPAPPAGKEGEEAAPPPPKADEGKKKDEEPHPEKKGTPGESPLETPPPPAKDEWAGYSSREEMLEAHKTLREEESNLRKQVNSLRKADGKLGRKVKDLETELATRTSELEELRKSGGKQGKEAPPAPKERPQKPDPAKFEDGEADAGYVDALTKYNADMETYVGSLESNIGKVSDRIASLESKVNETAGKAEEAATFAKTEKESREEKTVDQAWNGMWDETRKLQKDFGLATTVDIAVIDDYVVTANDANATKEDREKASNLFAKLPEADKAAYKRVAPIVKAMYAFDTGVPQKRFPNVQDVNAQRLAALWATTGADGRPLVESYSDILIPSGGGSAAAAAHTKKEKESESARALPAGDLGSPEDKITSAKTREEKLTRLKELSAARKKNIQGFDASKQAEEFRTLRKELGFYG